jgi:hypothetical protein
MCAVKFGKPFGSAMLCKTGLLWTAALFDVCADTALAGVGPGVRCSCWAVSMCIRVDDVTLFVLRSNVFCEYAFRTYAPSHRACSTGSVKIGWLLYPLQGRVFTTGCLLYGAGHR